MIGTYDDTGNSQNDEVDAEHDDLLGRWEPLALVHDEPEDGGEAVYSGLVLVWDVINGEVENLQLNQLPKRALCREKG